MSDPSPSTPLSGVPDNAAAEKKAAGALRAEMDREILRRLTSGDQAAFSDFYTRFAPATFSMIFEILRDQKDAEDVLQDAFVQIWQKAASYDPSRSNVFTWVIMIARHKAIDRLRSRARRHRLMEAASAEHAATPDRPIASAGEIVEQDEEARRIRAALRQLAEGQREAIDLAFFGGLTQAEISARLGAPLGTVKARIRRGLIALRDVLEKIS